MSQYFEVQVYDVFAIRGNAAIFKCQVPSFVADHVDVAGWIDSAGGNYRADDEHISYGRILCRGFFFLFCDDEYHVETPFALKMVSEILRQDTSIPDRDPHRP